MKNSDNSEKKRRGLRYWVADAVLLFLLGTVLLVAWYAFGASAASEEDLRSIEYVIRAEGVDSEILLGEEKNEIRIKNGDTVTDRRGVSLLGKVVDIRVAPSKYPTVINGAVAFAEHPKTVTLYLTVRADARPETGRGLRVSDLRIASGSVGDFRIGSFYVEGAKITVVRMAVNENENRT